VTRTPRRNAHRIGAVVLAAVLGTSGLAAETVDAKQQDHGERLARKLTRDVTPNGVFRHLRAFQRIAEQNGNTRAAGTPGYDASVDYVVGRLESAGFDVTLHDFEFEYSEDNSEFEQTSPEAITYVVGEDFSAAEFTPNATASGVVEGVDLVLPPAPEPNASTSGCEPEDFDTFTAGNIALLQRGTCDFVVKAENAQNAGAIGVVLFNEGQPGRTGVLAPSGELPGLTIPVIFATFDVGNALAAGTDVNVTITTDVLREMRVTQNVIAQTRTGRADNVVMAGAHLDSVPAGPGVNDNGSGSAALLETAMQLGPEAKVNNAVRFSFWGAEELGLLGSEAYVASLDFEQQLDIAMYLNFDMIGSPNAGYFVYDGDDSDGEGAGPGPFGSAQIEQTFVDYLTGVKGIETEGTDFSGRSDYGPFIAVAIPAGGLFTGAEVPKTEEQALKWGGEAGIPFDPCYHEECDNLGNVNRDAVDANSDALAWTIASYGVSTEDVNGIGDRPARRAARESQLAARTFAIESVTLADAA
jgi:Zn-dependent M28 family amino/carboxypeptidase